MEPEQIAEIIKSAREKAGYTQQQVADAIELGLRNYQHIEAGRFPKYKNEVIKKLEVKLNIKIFEQIYNTTNVSRETDNIVNDPPLTYLSQRRNRKNSSLPLLIPFVSRKAQAGYVKSYDQIQYMDTLEKYSLPPGVDPRGAEWLYFEIQGNSMEDTFKEEDIILCSMVPQMDWDELRNFYVYVIVTESELIIKRIYRKNKDKWVLISDNEAEYPQQYIDVDKIKQLWVYRKTWKTDAKPPKKFEIKI